MNGSYSYTETYASFFLSPLSLGYHNSFFPTITFLQQFIPV